MLCQYYIVMLLQPTTRYVMLKLMGQEGLHYTNNCMALYLKDAHAKLSWFMQL